MDWLTYSSVYTALPHLPWQDRETFSDLHVYLQVFLTSREALRCLSAWWCWGGSINAVEKPCTSNPWVSSDWTRQVPPEAGSPDPQTSPRASDVWWWLLLSSWGWFPPSVPRGISQLSLRTDSYRSAQLSPGPQHLYHNPTLRLKWKEIASCTKAGRECWSSIRQVCGYLIAANQHHLAIPALARRHPRPLASQWRDERWGTFYPSED